MTTKEVAKYLNLTTGRVRQLAISGELHGERHGRDWLFMRADVVAFSQRDRHVGRPPKDST